MPPRKPPLDVAQRKALFLKLWKRVPDSWLVANFMYEAGFSGVPDSCEPVRNVNPVGRAIDAERDARPILMGIATRHEISIDILIETDGSAVSEAIWCLREAGMDFESIRIATKRADYFNVVDACARVQRIMEGWPELRKELSVIARLPEAALRRLEVGQ